MTCIWDYRPAHKHLDGTLQNRLALDHQHSICNLDHLATRESANQSIDKSVNEIGEMFVFALELPQICLVIFWGKSIMVPKNAPKLLVGISTAWPRKIMQIWSAPEK